MDWIDQNALWLVLMCVLATAILIGGWMQTGRRGLAFAALIPALLAIGVVVLQQLIVTDREQVAATLQQIARAVEQNDVESVLEFIDPDAPQVASQARNELPRYEFGEVVIKRNLEVVVDQEHDPPRAVAEFNATVLVSERQGALQNQRVPRFVVVTLLKRDGRWRVAAYEHHPPQQSMIRRERALGP